MLNNTMIPQRLGIFLLIIFLFIPSAWGVSPSFQEFLLSEERAGRLDHESALLYQVYAIKDPERLPESVRIILESSPPLEEGTLIFREIQRRWWEWSPEFRSRVSPFFLSAPPSSPSLKAKGPSLGKSLLSGSHRMTYWAQTANFNFEWGSGIDWTNTTACDVDFSDSNLGAGLCPPVPDVVKRWAEYFETSWAAELEGMGYRIPEFAANGLVDVFFANTGCGAEWCKITQPTISALTMTYCGSLEFQGLDCTGRDNSVAHILIKASSSRSTAAHEFFHMIQFSYDQDDRWYDQDRWWLESTANWMEDQVFDDADGYVASIRNWVQVPQLSLRSLENDHEYGSSLFVFHLSETFGTEIVRDIWEDPPNNGIDGIQTIDAVLKRKWGGGLNTAFMDFTARNAVMDYEEGSQYGTIAIQETHASYPVLFSQFQDTTPPLDLYGAQYLRFLPPNGEKNVLTLSFDGRDDAAWGAMVVAVKKGGGYDPREIDLTASGQTGCLSISGFGSVYEAVYLIPSLLSQLSTDLLPLYDYEAHLDGACRVLPSENPSGTTQSSHSSSDKRCFIATAAYGSFEDPYVQLLRDFRDRYLTPYPAGRWLVEFYYRLSPPMADFITAHPFAAFLTRIALFPLIAIAALLV